ncbi:hypothetical protein TKK_0018287 [Trichogramma kaykai]
MHVSTVYPEEYSPTNENNEPTAQLSPEHRDNPEEANAGTTTPHILGNPNRLSNPMKCESINKEPRALVLRLI